MKRFIFFVFLLIVCFKPINTQTLTVDVVSCNTAPPWTHPDIRPDTIKVNFEVSPLDSVEVKIIRGYNRFNPDERGTDYFEIKYESDKNGLVKIDLSNLNEGDLFIISARKNRYVPIWKPFRYTKNMNSTKWIAYMIPRLKPDNNLNQTK